MPEFKRVRAASLRTFLGERMSYTALARKWRPRRFEEMAGQEHVLRALSNALRDNRLHHAFLFTGTRGVGKTTIARIFAKCLNCDEGQGPNPCGACASCQEIDAGRFPDLIEIDAASRTKVEDTRELLDNVQYMPSRGRFKVYLIDEVHMLSGHSFNALLKTLEEPPPHVKFLLATTDPQKLPVTVLSRCLQFNLKRLSVGLIVARLQHILEAEKLAFELPALRLLAQSADGSLRDALSLLDQLLAFGSGAVRESDAREMLGSVDRGQIYQLVDLLAQQKTAPLLAAAKAMGEFSPDYAQWLDALASLLAKVALYQAAPVAAEEDDVSEAQLADLAQRISAEDLQLYYQVALIGRRDLAMTSDPASAFALTLLRMLVFRPGGATPVDGESIAAPAVKAKPQQATRPAPSQAARPAPSQAAELNWSALLEQLALTGIARQLASHCTFLERTGAVMKLQLDPRGQSIRSAASEEKLAAALTRHFGETIRLSITMGAGGSTPARERDQEQEAALAQARAQLAADPAVQALQQQFGATIFEQSVRPTGK